MSQPWFRHPLVWMLIAIPSAAVIAGMVTIYLAVNTDDGLVVDDYYKHGLAINRVIERDETAMRLQLGAVVEIDTETGYIRVEFDPGKLDALPLELRVQINHAVHKQEDAELTLYRGIGNQYVGAVNGGISEGIWYFQLSDVPAVEEEGGEAHSSWRLSQRARLQGQTSLNLQPHL